MYVMYIDDDKYLRNLFNNLSKQGSLPATLELNNTQYHNTLSFNYRKKGISNILIENKDDTDLENRNFHISFSYEGVLFKFCSSVLEHKGRQYILKIPDGVYASLRRIVKRYNVKQNENISICFPMFSEIFVPTDISTGGFSFLADEDFLFEGQIVKNIKIKLPDGSNFLIDGNVISCEKENNKYTYRISFVKNDLLLYPKLFNYIFKNTNHDLLNLYDCPIEELNNLTDRIKQLNLKCFGDTGIDIEEKIRDFYKLSKHPEIFFGVVNQKNQEVLSMMFASRIYNQTFLIQQFVPCSTLKPSFKTIYDTQNSLAEFILNHPSFEYCFMYNETNFLSKYIYENVEKFIGDNNKFSTDLIDIYDCEVNKNVFIHSEYSIRVADNLSGFFGFCDTSLSSLESGCYGYNAEDFDLAKTNTVYNSLSLSAYRKLFEIYKGDTLVAYAVAEFFSNCFSINNICDISQIYFLNDNLDKSEVISAILPELKKYYKFYEKDVFKICLKKQYGKTTILDLKEIHYSGTFQKVIMNKTGLSLFQKLTSTNLQHFSKYYPLTYPQKSIWYTEKMYPGTSVGNIASTVRIKEKVDFGLLETAVNTCIEKNDSLRLRFIEENEEPFQYIAQYENKKIDLIDLQEKELAEIYAWDEKQTALPFDLLGTELFYFAMMKISENEGGLYLKMHHLISDGWTTSSLINQIIEHYGNLKNGKKAPRIPKPSYIDYIFSEEEYRYSDKFISNALFWKNKFKTVPEFTLLKTNIPGQMSLKSKRITHIISKDLTQKLKLYCSQRKASVFSVMLSVMAAYIYRITSKNDIVLGTPILNRATAKEKDTSGMYISAIPIRFFIDENESFDSLVATTSKELMLYLKNHKYPYEFIQKDFRNEHSLNHNIYDVVVSYQNSELEKQEHGVPFQVRWHPNNCQTETLVLHINDRDNDGTYILNFDYLESKISEEEIHQILGHFLNLIQNGIEDPGNKLCKLEILSEKEKHKLLFEFNNTDANFPGNMTIPQLFEEQVKMTPNNIAVVFENKQITYQELNKKANRLAGILRKKRVKPNDIVGIIAERSIEMIVGMLGVLKSGAAYMPIDPEYPEERISYMIKDSHTSIILVDKSTKKIFKHSGKICLILLDSPSFEDDSNLETICDSFNLAYLIYTSGSTGNPKGVMVAHRGMANLQVFFKNSFHINENDRIAQFASISFDASVWEIFMALLTGATLFILSKEIISNYNKFEEFLNINKISTVTLPPVYAEGLNPKNIFYLKRIITAGSASNEKLLNKWKDQVEYINGYGPTETTICATAWSSLNCSSSYNNVPIGSPLINTKVFILDKHDNLQPIGGIGELCVSGVGLSAGYLGNPQLTMQKFVDNPFFDQTKMYKTGDMAKWLPDGNIEFVGRVDSQVKIRGHRVELGEIENQLLKHSLVKDAVVIIKETESGNSTLYAFFTSAGSLSQNDLKNYLFQKLPEYMIPSLFIKLDEIPLTSNGKPNKKTLQKQLESYEYTCACTEKEHLEPVNEMEKILIGAWKKILGKENISTSDNFFELGGDSIGVIQLVSNLHKFNLNIDSKNIYKYPTIRELSEYVKQLDQPLCKQDFKGEIRLSPIQKWFFQSEISNKNLFNQSILLHSKEGFDVEITKKVFEKFVSYHDAFRIIFEHKEKEISQFYRDIHDISIFEIKVIDLCSLQEYFSEIDKHSERAQRKIDLWSGKLFDLTIYKTIEGDYLSIIIHHLIIDGISWRILLEDFNSLYIKIKEKKEITLSKKTASFKTWSEKLHDYATSDDLQREAIFWKKSSASDYISTLPYDAINLNDNDAILENCIKIKFSEKETNILFRNCASFLDTNINEILLTAFGGAISKITDYNEILINIETHGRENLGFDINVSRTIGWFTCLYPLLLEIPKTNDLFKQIKAIKRFIRKVPNNGIGYGILKYLNRKDSKKMLPESKISFNYLGNFDNSFPNSMFKIIASASGLFEEANSGRKGAIDFNSMIVNNELAISLTYDVKCYKRDTMQELLNNFSINLWSIINMCENKEKERSSYLKMETSNLYDLILSGKLPKVDAAALLYLPDEMQAQAGIVEGLFKENPMVYSIIQTWFGSVALIIMPLFKNELFTNKNRLLIECSKAISTAYDIGAQKVSLVGFIPAVTDNGREVSHYVKENKTFDVEVINAHVATCATMVLTLERMLIEANRDLSKEKLCILGVGSMGESVIELILKVLSHPKKILFLDVYDKKDYLIDLSSKLKKDFAFRNEIKFCFFHGNQTPDEVYSSTIMFGTTYQQVLDINKLKSGTLIIDDFAPNSFSVEKAISRFYKSYDILFSEGNLLQSPLEMQKTVYSPKENALNVMREFEEYLSNTSVITGCNLSALLRKTLNNLDDLSDKISLKNSYSYYLKLKELGFIAAPFHCGDFTLDKEIIEKFRNKYGES